MWMAIVAIAITVAQQISSAVSGAAAEKFKLEQAALKEKHAAQTAKLNAGAVAVERTLAMRSMETQALMQGLSDGIAMSQNNVRQSSTGTALGSSSKSMGAASQRLMHVINQANMEFNRTSKLSNLETKKINFMGDALIHQTNAEANTFLADSIDIQKVGINALLTAGASSYTQFTAAGGFANSAQGAAGQAPAGGFAGMFGGGGGAGASAGAGAAAKGGSSGAVSVAKAIK